MMRVFRKSIFVKPFSVMMAFIFLLFTFMPQNVWALGSGPNQPELESFSPVGMDNMVNVFTGDFNYNLPLLTVPGPNGGYPINMTYNAGVGIDQEATWVGLGWNLNPGVVNRELRGLPDDLNGQEVTKTLSQKKNWTLAATMGAGLLADTEIFGADISKIASGELSGSQNITLSYNSYSGFNAKFGASLGYTANLQQGDGLTAKLTSLIDTALGKIEGKKNFQENVGESKSEVDKEFSFSNLNHKFAKNVKDRINRSANNPVGVLTRAAHADISDVNYTHPFTNGSYSFNAKIGLDNGGVTVDIRANVLYNYQKIADQDKVQKVPAYGYMYSDQSIANDNPGLMDFTLMDQSMITPDSKVLPIPNHTYDVFQVKSQGVSGTVRPFKGGLSVLTDANVVTKGVQGGAGAEFKQAITTKFGVNLQGGYSETYTGPWKGGTQEVSFLKDALSTKKETYPYLEPYYFKFAGELTAETNGASIFSNTQAKSFDITTQMGELSYEAKLKSNLIGSNFGSITASNIYRQQRERRAKLFFTLTEKEARQFDGYERQVYDAYTEASIPASLNLTGSTSGMIGAAHVTDESGTRYIYGIPAKNKVHKSVMFSVNQPSFGTQLGDMIPKTTSYSAGSQNSMSNSAGQDNHYSSTELPEYAHSFLLTEIVSEDYVDLSSDGPTVDDFGDYVRFDYWVQEDFKSRSSTTGASYLPGKYSNGGDDKGSYTYFEKDIFYVKAIETKTHIAVFELGTRFDARGISDENGTYNSNGTQKKTLEKITLYNVREYKDNPSTATPIKTVNFVYDYSLCPGTPNSNGVGTNGKLTLKKVWFSVGAQTTKASLSPYEFGYGYNPDYDEQAVDRWASFQPDTANPFESNILYPYATKNKNYADVYAGAWCLDTIKLPTKGKIIIDYEADDYQYVQDKRAQNMYEIVGFTDGTSGSISTSLANDNRYMIVELDKEITASQIPEYVSGLSELYFKAFMKMKSIPSGAISPSAPFNEDGTAYDFVNGYANFSSSDVALYPPSGSTSKRITIKINKLGGSHPIKKAGWIELQTSRNDLMDEDNFSADGFESITAGLLGKIGRIISGAISFLIDNETFFIKAQAKGWCNQLSSAGGLHSVVRLNAPDAKVGGGHRVSKIEIYDQWNAMDGGKSKVYGQRYSYDLIDGTSSGVAQYEPMVGGEENPFRKPIRYSTNKILFKNNYLYVEEPLGEELFPSPTVGYSRVVVTNLANDHVTVSGEGVKVHEYYTAKDYPVTVSRTSLTKVNTDIKDKLIKLIGGKSYHQPGFSQGFSVELNDMHGKEKSQSNFSAYANVKKDVPISKTEYYYKTKQGYNLSKINNLESNADVFYGDGISRDSDIGKTVDTYIYLKESGARSIAGDIDANLDIQFPFAFVPTAYPNIDYSYNMTRIAAMNTVTERTGILERVVNYTNGAKVETENLAFDYDTGEPIVTSVTNDFNEKIYNYNQKAKWAYGEMGGAYQNIGGYYDLIEQTPGDIYMDENGDKSWVQANTSQLLDKSGSQLSIDHYKLVKSGYGNNLTQNFGSVQSTVDPRTLNGNLSVFKAYNDNIAGTGDTIFTYTDCKYDFTATNLVSYETDTNYAIQFDQATNSTYNDWVFDSPNGYTHHVNIDNDNSGDTIYNIDPAYNNGATRGSLLQIELFFYTDLAHPDPTQFEFYYVGSGKFLAIHPDGYEATTAPYNEHSCPNPPDCFGKCMNDVLNTNAMTFTDSLKSITDIASSDTAGLYKNPYAYNFKGVYKQLENYYYPTVRDQTKQGSDFEYKTDISHDGKYNEFVWFEPSNSNASWKVASTVSQYDYNGMPVEEKNALENYSAVLYGHNRSLPIAVGANCKYEELAFNGFEDYGYTGVADGKSNHLDIGNTALLTSEGGGHTGKYGVQMGTATTDVYLENSNALSLEEGKEYLVQLWHLASSGGTVTVRDPNGDNNAAKVVASNIDGWDLLEIQFVAGADPHFLRFTGTNAVYDDIKLQPFNASVKTYIYDDCTQQLVAALDENHYATLYNYDRDMVLVQVKKETQKGIKTIQSTMRSSSQIANP